MRLIRIGHRVFNVSALVQITFGHPYDQAEFAVMHFAAPEGSGADGESMVRPYREILQGPEVSALRIWLLDNCDLVTIESAAPPPAADPDDDSIPF